MCDYNVLWCDSNHANAQIWVINIGVTCSFCILSVISYKYKVRSPPYIRFGYFRLPNDFQFYFFHGRIVFN